VNEAKKILWLLLLLIALAVTGSLLHEGFLSAFNLQNLARLLGLHGLLGLGVGFVIVTGGIDLSIGSMLALLGVLLSIALREWSWPPGLALLFVLGVTSSLGLAHGLLVTRLALQPFLVTLCGLLLYRGLARFVAGDETKGFGAAEGFEGLRDLLAGDLLGLPAPFVVLALTALVLHVVLHHSVFGRHLLATGCNETAARYAGVRTGLVITTAYVLCGLLAGLSGVLTAFYTNSVQPSNHGSFYELYGIAAAVLGGCSLRGGEGSVVGIVLGAAVILVIQNLVNLLGIPSALNFAVLGGVILAATIVDRLVRGPRA
jgi:ribose transport system permease protein